MSDLDDDLPCVLSISTLQNSRYPAGHSDNCEESFDENLESNPDIDPSMNEDPERADHSAYPCNSSPTSANVVHSSGISKSSKTLLKRGEISYDC